MALLNLGLLSTFTVATHLPFVQMQPDFELEVTAWVVVLNF
jgi:hypothetical protein